MPFKSSIYPNTKLVVVGLVHATGYDTAFNNSDDAAKEYLEQLFSKPFIFTLNSGKHTYFLPALWGDRDIKMADVHRFTTDDWPGNPEYKAIVYKNGIYNQIPKSHGCMETLSLIAEIEKIRKKTGSLEEFERILKCPVLMDVPEIRAFFE